MRMQQHLLKNTPSERINKELTEAFAWDKWF